MLRPVSPLVRHSYKSNSTESPSLPEVCPEIDNLPRSQRNEHADGAKAKPLDAVVGALIRVSQLLLAGTEIVHLVHDLLDHLLDAAQLGLDRLELLRSLDGGPVLGVRSNVNIELNLPGVWLRCGVWGDLVRNCGHSWGVWAAY
jgi:hypothetical protein